MPLVNIEPYMNIGVLSICICKLFVGEKSSQETFYLLRYAARPLFPPLLEIANARFNLHSSCRLHGPLLCPGQRVEPRAAKYLEVMILRKVTIRCHQPPLIAPVSLSPELRLISFIMTWDKEGRLVWTLDQEISTNTNSVVYNKTTLIHGKFLDFYN